MSTASGTAVSIHPWADLPAEDHLDFHLRNRDAFEEWEPVATEGFFTLPHQLALREMARAEANAGLAQRYAVVVGGAVGGRVTLSNIVRGAAQCAHLGYAVDAALWGRGVATAGVRLVLHEAFTSLQLHRVEAAVMPHNVRSIRVVEKCGFVLVGLSPRHLRIAGEWRDHLLYELTAEDWSAQQTA